MIESDFKRLLSEGESSRLDYKARQYPFASASDGQEAELLKDILAMANASREVDAFILIGIQEQSGARAQIVGIAEHLDDADLQQFVNSKTNRPVQFSYTEFQSAGATVAAIRLPIQRRPFFLKKRFGSLDANAVYMRRGSATVKADPDEVHDMGVSSAIARKPTLTVEFADVRERRTRGCSVRLEQLVLKPLKDNELPVVTEPPDPMALSSAFSVVDGYPNCDYWKEMREYSLVRNAAGRLGFAITNQSPTVAVGVRVVLTMPLGDDVLVVQDVPQRPRERHNALIIPALNYSALGMRRRDVEVQTRGKACHVEVAFGKVQPGATVWTDDDLLIGTLAPRELVMEGHIFGDNFEPAPVEFRIDSQPTTRPMSLDDLQLARYDDN